MLLVCSVTWGPLLGWVLLPERIREDGIETIKCMANCVAGVGFSVVFGPVTVMLNSFMSLSNPESRIHEGLASSRAMMGGARTVPSAPTVRFGVELVT